MTGVVGPAQGVYSAFFWPTNLSSSMIHAGLTNIGFIDFDCIQARNARTRIRWRTIEND
jgi:hypothetical protein